MSRRARKTARPREVRGRTGLALLVLALLSMSSSAFAEETLDPAPDSKRPPFRKRIIDDYRHYYSASNGLYLGAAFGVGAALANTDADGEVQRWYASDVRSDDSNDVARVVKEFGEWPLMGGISLGVAILGSESLAGKHFGPLGTLGEWGERNVRALALGTPPLLLMQRVTGGSRPLDRRGSGWDFWADSNGVSGHAFVGAIPFLTAAEMTDSLALKAVFFGASGLTAWSRINDDSHYLSQALLGWFMAWRAVYSVDASEDGGSLPNVDIVPVAGTGAAIMISGRF